MYIMSIAMVAIQLINLIVIAAIIVFIIFAVKVLIKFNKALDIWLKKNQGE